ncbi:MAG: hypothetical protein JNL13_04825 [Chitinophagaceae bacterium]|nr:hypothetical protein [Chitinophagaceae bacterium]
MHRIRTILYLLPVLLSGSCTRQHKIFTLKTIRLNDYRQAKRPAQKLHLEVVEGNTLLAHTAPYPSELTLPVSFKAEPAARLSLYSKTYSIQLHGDSSGLIGSCNVTMEEYKIIFPIDMEVRNDSLSVSILGSWQ